MPGSKISNTPEDDSFAPYLLQDENRGEDTKKYMKLSGGRLKRQEKAKGGNLWDCIKGKCRNTYFFHIGGSGQLTASIYSTWR